MSWTLILGSSGRTAIKRGRSITGEGTAVKDIHIEITHPYFKNLNFKRFFRKRLWSLKGVVSFCAKGQKVQISGFFYGIF